MAPPSAEELLTRTPLPREADPFFKDYTVSGSVAPCGREDDLKKRILVNPTKTDTFFPDPDDVSPSTTFLNPADSFFPNVLTGVGGFVYQRTLQGPGGKPVPGGLGVMHLCRKDAPTPGSFELYVSDNPIINNIPGNPVALRRVPLNFHFEDIRAIVEGLHRDDGTTFHLSSDHYQVDPMDHSQLSLFPDPTLINDIIAMVKMSDSPIPAAKRQPIVDALEKMMSRENSDVDFRQRSMDMQEKMRTDMMYQIIGSTVIGAGVGLYGILLASGKAGGINNAVTLPFRGLYNLIRAPFDKGEGLARFWQDATTPFRYRGISTLLSIGTNMTEQARLDEFRPAADSTTPEVAKQIENTIDSKYNTMSVLVEGPPGWGKEVVMQTLALRNPETVYIKVTPNGMMGGTMYRGQLEQRLTDIPREIMKAKKEGRKVVLFVDEFHEALSAGKSMESTTSLLEHWKGELARGDIRIVGFSTPREMLKARYIAGVYNDPKAVALLNPEFRDELEQFKRDGVRQNLELRPLLNRFQPLPLPPRPAADIPLILKDKIAERQEGSGFKIEMDDAALERITQLSESPVAKEGFIPRTALALFNGVIDANTASGASSVTITRDMIDGYVQKNYPDIAQRFSLSNNAQVDSLKDNFTEKDFADLIRQRYPELRDAKFDRPVAIAGQEAQRRWKAALEADPHRPPLMNVDGHAFPSEEILDGAVRSVSAGLTQLKKPLAEEFRKAIEKGVEPLVLVAALPANLAESGRKAFVTVSYSTDQRNEVAEIFKEKVPGWSVLRPDAQEQKIDDFLRFHDDFQRQADGGRGMGLPSFEKTFDYFLESNSVAPTNTAVRSSSALSSQDKLSLMKEKLSENVFRELILKAYPDLRNPKYDIHVSALALLARDRFFTEAEANPDRPPLRKAGDGVLPDPRLIQEALKEQVRYLEEKRHPDAQEIKVIFEKGMQDVVLSMKVTGWDGDKMRKVDDHAIFESLKEIDPKLAAFYRENISTKFSRVATIDDLITRVGGDDVAEAALQDVRSRSESMDSVTERALFALIAKAAEDKGVWTDDGLKPRVEIEKKFESEMRTREGLEKSEGREPRKEEKKEEKKDAKAEGPLRK